MMLDAVTSCEVTHRSYPALLVLAAVVFLAGIMMNTPRDQSPSAYGLLLAMIIVFAYLGTRRQVVRISSPSAHIDVLLSGVKFEQALGAVEAVETAKDLRYRLAWAPVGYGCACSGVKPRVRRTKATSDRSGTGCWRSRLQ
jgi:hypothetical protein